MRVIYLYLIIIRSNRLATIYIHGNIAEKIEREREAHKKKRYENRKGE